MQGVVNFSFSEKQSQRGRLQEQDYQYQQGLTSSASGKSLINRR
jgi:hypothetical protein